MSLLQKSNKEFPVLKLFNKTIPIIIFRDNTEYSACWTIYETLEVASKWLKLQVQDYSVFFQQVEGEKTFKKRKIDYEINEQCALILIAGIEYF